MDPFEVSRYLLSLYQGYPNLEKNMSSNLENMAEASRIERDLLIAISDHYAADSCKPGIIKSWLSHNKLWYASVIRHPNGPGSKEVIVSSTNQSLYDVVRDIATKWLDTVVEESAIAKLRKQLGK